MTGNVEPASPVSPFPSWTPSNLRVGVTTVGNLAINGGGWVDVTGQAMLGLNAGSEGTVMLGGNGSRLTTTTQMHVGSRGDGVLGIQGGADVNIATFLYIGRFGGADGLVTVSGAGSSLSNGSMMQVGSEGNGALVVEDGGAVNSIGVTRIALSSASAGSVLVQGANSSWTMNNSLSVGFGGHGSLAIDAGGLVRNVDGLVGREAGSTGEVTVSGAGSTWTNSAELYVGSNGSGTLIVADGGTVTNTSYAYIGYADGSSGTATVTGAGSTWSSAATLRVGHTGTGVLTIADGGKVESLVGTAGANATGSGTVLVTGPGSTWTSTTNMSVGFEGHGTLTIEDGGAVNDVTGFIGRYAGATGTATVTGAGSTWSNTGSLTVGDAGQGTLLVEDGGTVSSVGGYIGYAAGSSGSATVTGAGSAWTSSSSLYVGTSGDGTLTIADGATVASSDYAFLGAAAGSSGSATVTGTGSAWNNSSYLHIGASGEGVLTIADGATVNNSYGYIGLNAGSQGTATVTGAGSTWNNSYLHVGQSGEGVLTIADGATVNNTYGYIGLNAGSQGTATVSGAGTSWINNGHLYVGERGQGTLLVKDGGAVSSKQGNIGFNAGSVGDALVTGTGSTWTSSGSLHVGSSGTGSLEVKDGGTVTSAAIGFIGYQSGSSGTVTVTGGDSTLALTGNSNLHVGWLGQGTLIVSDGGSVSNVGARIGGAAGGSGEAVVDGEGSAWTNSSTLSVGHTGEGALTISNGGHVSNTGSHIGYTSGVSGTARVTGAGSTWSNAGTLYAGFFGDALLTVEEGGRIVSTDVSVARFAGSTGAVTVSGANTTWSNSGAFLVGHEGTGELTVENGGTVTGTSGFIGYVAGSAGAATVTGADSTWTNSSALYVGSNSAGTLTVANGGTVTNASYGYIGYAAGSSGSATVTGDGSIWTNSGELRVGHAGDGTLVVADGGTVTNTSYGYIGYAAGSTGAATVTGAGSTWNSGPGLYIGYEGDGTLTVADGGTVTAATSLVGLFPTARGEVLVTGAGSTWNAGNIAVAQSGSGEVTVAAGGRVTSVNSYLGNAGGAFGAAVVSGAGSQWASSGEFRVGQFGNGALLIADGATVTSASGTVGYAFSSTGEATVTGAGSVWANAGVLAVANYGHGTLTIADGGAVTSTEGYIGRNVAVSGPASGTVVVSGMGSTWTNSGELRVGDAGDGTLTVADGGGVTNTQGTLGASAGSAGTATVTGTGSTWTNSGELRVGDAGDGTLTVADGGHVAVGGGHGVVHVAAAATARGVINIGAAASDAAAAAGTLAAGEIRFGAGAGTLNFNHTESAYLFSSAITGAGTLNQRAGTTILTGDSSYTGGTAISGGTLQLGQGGASGAIVGDVVNNGTLVFNRSNAFTLAGAISGSGEVRQVGAGTTILTGANSYGGDTIVNGGRLQFGDGTLGGTNTLGGGIAVTAGTLSIQTPATVGIAGDAHFADHSALDLIATLGSPSLSADGVAIGNGVAFNLAGINNASQLDQILIDTENGITGDFGAVTVGGFNGAVDYLTLHTRKSNDGKQYLATYGLSWTAHNNLGHGAFTLVNPADIFTVGVALADEAANPATGWDGTALTKAGTGTLILTADNIYTGDTTISGGTLQLGQGGTSGSIIGDVVNNGTLAFNRTDTATFGGTISGSGAVSQIGAGTTTLTGANSYTGGTRIDAGTLRISADAGLGDASGGVTLNGGTLDFAAALSSTRTVTVGTNGGTVLLDDGNVTLSGLLSGAGNLAKGGADLLRYTGDGSAYAGTFAVTDGDLRLDGTLGGSLVTSVGTTLSGIGTAGDVTVNGTIAPGNSIGTLSVTGDLVLNTGAILEYQLGAPGSVLGTGTSDRIAVAGHLTLDGAANLRDAGGAGLGYYRLMTYGSLTDNGLDIGETPALGTSSYEILVGGGFVDLRVGAAGDANLQIWQGGDGVWNATNANWLNQGAEFPTVWASNHGAFTGSGGLVEVAGTQSFKGLQFVTDGYELAGSGTLQTVPDGSELRVLAGVSATIGTAMSGPGGIVKTQGGTLVLTGPNTYAGGTTVEDGVLSVAADSALGAAEGALALKGGIFQVTGDSYQTTDRAISIGANGGGIDVASAGNVLTLGQGIAGIGDLHKLGLGVLTLTGTNTYADGFISQGTLRAGARDTFAAASALTVAAGARLDLDGFDQTVGALAGAGAVTLGTGTLTFGGNDGDTSFSGTISGTGGLVKDGTGTTVLTGDSTYTGATTIAGGVLQLGHGGATGTLTSDIQIDGAGSLRVDRSGDWTYAGVLSGTGAFDHEGSGATTLTGDSSAFDGATTVTSGSLIVGQGGVGALGGIIDVLSGATLGGSGTLGSAGTTVTVADGGTHTPGDGLGPQTVLGNYRLRGTLHVDGTPAAADTLVVHGDVDVAGSILDLQLSPTTAAGWNVINGPFTIIDNLGADAVNGTFASVTNTLLFLDPHVGYAGGDGNDVTLDLVRNDVAFASTALTPNQIATSTAIDTLPFGDPVWNTIALMSDATAARRSFDLLSGEIHATAQGALLEESRFPRTAANDRLRAVGAAPADPETAVWAEAYGSWANWHGDGNAAALARNTGGLLLGFEDMLGDWRLGVMTGWNKTRMTVADRASSAEAETWHAGAYGGTRWGDVDLRLGLLHAEHAIETHRTLALPALSETLRGAYDAGTTQAFGELAHRIDLDAFGYEPFANLAHVRTRSDRFAEAGGDAALAGQPGGMSATLLTVGQRLKAAYDLDAFTVKTSAMIAWQHVFSDPVPLSAHSFSASDAFVVAGTPLARDSVLVEAGLEVSLGDAATIAADYTGRFARNGHDHAVTADVRVGF